METNIESKTKKTQGQLPLYFFGFLGLSCFACCAIILLLVGIGWLASSTDFVLNIDWRNTMLMMLIGLTILPIAGIYFHRKNRK